MSITNPCLININFKKLQYIAIAAGNKILEYYYTTETVISYKEDESPLTLADLASHQIILNGLKSLTPHIPIISEEGRQIPYDERKNYKYSWIVDQLDGTKEFINNNDEFTVNIVLVKNGESIPGVIFAPAIQRNFEQNGKAVQSNKQRGIMSFGMEGLGSFKISGESSPVSICIDM